MALTRRICFAALAAFLLIAPANVEARQIALAWDGNPEPAVTGYTLSYGTQPGVYTTSVNVGNLILYLDRSSGRSVLFRRSRVHGSRTDQSDVCRGGRIVCDRAHESRASERCRWLQRQCAACGHGFARFLHRDQSAGRPQHQCLHGPDQRHHQFRSRSVQSLSRERQRLERGRQQIERPFTWTIGANNAPSLTSPGNRTSAANAIVSLQLAATDPDGDVITYSATGAAGADGQRRDRPDLRDAVVHRRHL